MSALLAGLPAQLGLDGLEHPVLGAVLLLLAAALAFHAHRQRPCAIAWPAMGELAMAGGRGTDWQRGLAGVLRFGALAALALALAGPVALFRGPPEAGRALDIVLVVDTSGSMRALDAELGGAWRTRLDLAREVVARFARARTADGDRVGLVVFGENAFTQCPVTSDAALLDAALERVEAGMAGEATALGDALALAVRRVARTAGTGDTQPEGAAKPDVPDRPGAPKEGRVVVLLTDGRSNAGEVPTDVAAGLARTLGVRVHTVGIGTEGPVAMAAGPGNAHAGLRFERHDLDAETLELVARSTGGRFFRARRPQELDAVYAGIDALERVPRRPPPQLRREAHPEPALALAASLLGLELLASRVLGRRIP